MSLFFILVKFEHSGHSEHPLHSEHPGHSNHNLLTIVADLAGSATAAIYLHRRFLGLGLCCEHS